MHKPQSTPRSIRALPVLALAISATIAGWSIFHEPPPEPVAIMPVTAAQTTQPAPKSPAPIPPATNTPYEPSSIELAATVTPHHIPASQLVPAPTVAWVPPKVIEPPNPATSPLDKNNPGGVNGTRPPREALH